MVGLGQFRSDLVQFGSVHGRFESVLVGSWSGLCQFMGQLHGSALGRFMVSLGQFSSVWVGSWSIWVSLGRFMVGL